MDDERRKAARKAGEDFVDRLLAPRPGTINWRGPNWWTFIVFVGAFTLANLKPGNAVRDFLFDKNVIGALFGGISGLVRLTTRFYAERIEDFVPRTAMEAKRANEQIKSLSTAINALAAGSAVAVTAKQLSEPTPDYPLVIIAIGLGVWIHTGARHLLGLLKDESISATRPLKSPPRKLAAVWMRYNLPNGTHCAAAPHPAQRGNRTIAFSVAGGVRRNFSGKQHPLSQ